MQKQPLVDTVPRINPGSEEIGFEIPERYNASSILFDNLDRGLSGKVAVYGPAGDATYGELCDDACRFGNALLDLGLERGSRIALVLDDTRTYPAAIFGAIRAGFVPVLLNTASPGELLEYFIADSEAPMVVIQGSLAAVLVSEKLAERLPRLQHVVVADGEAPSIPGVACHEFPAMLGASSNVLAAADTHRDDMAFWMYSSGSTGRPKGIVHLQHDMAYTHQSYAANILEIGADDICFSPPKIFFAYGFGNSLTFPFSVGASTVLLPGRPLPDAVFQAIARYQPTLFFGLPTLYNAMINSDAARDASLDGVRLCLSAAETLSAELAQRWSDRFGLPIVEGLGSTEVLHIYLSNTPEDRRTGSAGRRVPGYEIRLLDDAGSEVADGESGVLWVRGDSQTPGYWNKPEKTAETVRDGWIMTGDRFKRDADGFHYFLGRADDLIKVSGQWVYPLEVEHCLQDHESVRECAVLGVRMQDGRMTLEAHVVLHDKTLEGDEMTRRLSDYVKQRLLPYKYPRIVHYRDQLPKTGTGKVDRQRLAESKG